MENVYKPELMEVLQVTQHTADVKSVRIRFRDPAVAEKFTFRVGQFGMFSAFGTGESTFNICSSSTWKDFIEFCFRRTGKVTDVLWRLDEGDTIGFRGPYGNSYPVEQWEGRNLIFIGGGIAMPPIRCAIWYALENRAKYGNITIVYGARTVGDMVFANELDEWEQRERTRVIRCVDPGGETPEWKHEVGLIPHVIERSAIPADNTVALVVGPPIMIKFTLPVLDKMGIGQEDIYTSLENRMKCGIGKCGRCNCGPVYVCKEGPVFSLAQLGRLPNDY
ncbi:MAG TPA: FAD/NAD(P)-binding protein [Candidatus Hydrogenedentes bacterium]|nr:FAD/NAD(P)-binding protein [Candidatus Hydrogenedentota bacterium]HOT50329.1 FAD/NAD(P)-binding protein [Candidatus Hydrogenedentota bacterium]HOV73117.1 FAD/NAD(P)-binding protein [Candidatus Hydrogenedentota bacterium]HPC16217.1 FAD/NAD(P)-binding protein [Candidatus Hydrogenedentota bacterium]HRT18571.1 FAD/NAD(P)-binding protein [Candidatus Hydrogenedentota bacterium]